MLLNFVNVKMFNTVLTRQFVFISMLCEFSGQIFFGIVLVMPTFLSAFNGTYAAVALPQMGLDINISSWFTSIPIYASPLSVIIIGFLIDRFGRKKTLLYCIAPSIGGWLLLYWNYNVPLLLLGQALNGLSIGAGYYPVQVYVGECIMANNVRMRNIFMTWISLSNSFGTTLTLILGNLFHYNRVSLIASIMCIAMLFLFFLIIPESPVWLYRQGRVGDAEWSQKQLGMSQSILSSAAVSQPQVQETSWLRTARKITRPDVYKPTIILSISSMVLSWCGSSTITAYIINVIGNTIPGVSNPVPFANSSNIISETLAIADEQQLSYRLSLYSGLFMCLGSIVSVFVLPLLGLKKMLITSKLFLVVAMLAVTYGSQVEPVENMLVRVAGVTIITFLVGLEIGPKMSFAGDVFPVDAKGFASIPALTGSLSIATCNKIFPYLRVEFGGFAYCFFAVICVMGVVYIHFFVPEVVGRTLEDINNQYVEDDKKVST